MMSGTSKKQVPVWRATLSFLKILPVALLIPACTGGSNKSSASPPSFGGLVSATPSGSAGQVVLTWSPGVDFSGTGLVYNVFYCIGSLPAQSGQETLQLTTANSTGVTVTGLVSGDPYLFLVQAQDGSGKSDGNGVELGAKAP